MASPTIRFGVWAPVHGPRAALQDPAEPFDASWERNRAVVLEAEALGFDSTLVAQHTVNPHLPDHDQLGSDGGTAAGLVGSHDQVAERIQAFHAAGIELFMLQFQPLRSELRRFAAEIFPRVGKTVATDRPARAAAE